MLFRTYWGDLIIGCLATTFTIILLVNYNVLIGLELVFVSILMGCFAAIAWSVLYSLMHFSLNKQLNAIKPCLFDEEVIVLDGVAKTVMPNREYGKLFLTSKRLMFYPGQNANNQKAMFIDLKDIDEVKTEVNFKVLNYCLKISVDNKDTLFEVEFVPGWKDVIDGQLSYNK